MKDGELPKGWRKVSLGEIMETESYQKIKISLPLLSEQKRIVSLLDTSKREIEVLKQLAEQHHTQKRGLMQKLLTGKWRIQTGDH